MGKKTIREIHNVHLRDPKVACEYLNEAFASEEPAIILMAIRNIVEAQEGGFASVAERAHLGRESMYKMLSTTGNPKLNSLVALFHSVGLQLCVKQHENWVSDTQISCFNTHMTFFLIMFVVSYLLGSISSAIIICKLCGLPDPRTQGSHNPGATNVLRFGGKKVAAAVLLGDAFKGLIPVTIVVIFAAPDWVVTLTALFAFLGHVFPIFFGFQGGKGVATYLGTMLGACWLLGVIAIGSWLLTALATRYSSLSAVVMSIVVPIAGYFFFGFEATIPLIMMTFILLFRHGENIKRLLKGQESKIGAK